MSAIIHASLLCFSIIAQVSAYQNNVLSAEDEGVSQSEIKNRFKQWTLKYHPAYGFDQSIYTYREKVYGDNYKKIMKHNLDKSQTYTLEENQFSDITEEEFKELYLNPIEQTNPLIFEKHKFDESETATNFGTNFSSIPSSIDWRQRGAVTEVKNQGQCHSCWAFAATGMLEGVHQIRGNRLVSYSEQQLVDCCGQKGLGCEGCNRGWPHDAVRFVQTWGLLETNEYPEYAEKEYACEIKERQGLQINGQTVVQPNLQSFREALARQPLAVVLDATNWQFYSSGVFNNCSSRVEDLNHAVVAVGYTQQNQWIIKNSWGVGWGSSGYITLAAGNTCGIYNFAIAAHI